MTWSDTRTKLRRFLRDPAGNIWGDSFLLRIWNTAQHRFRNSYGLIEDVVSLKVPPEYDYCYAHDWESAFVSGESWKFSFDYDPEPATCTFFWEAEVMSGSSADSSGGTAYTYPWEAYAVSSPGTPPPFHAPDDFEEMLFAAWDRKPLEPTTLREVMDQDGSWRTHTGLPQKYYRDDEVSDTMFLWPILALSEWNDGEEDEADPDTADYGATTLDIDNNLLIIVKKAAAELVNDSDESDFPAFLLKYIDHLALTAAYSTNTDGRIESLRDYWQYRTDIDKKIMERYKTNRMADREYRLSPVRISRHNKRHAQLPDHFPVVYP